MSHNNMAQPDEADTFIERIDDATQLAVFPDHLARYRFALQWAPAMRVLDVCCGVGYGSTLLAAAGAIEVHGVDISEEAIEAAKHLPSLPNISFAVADACLGLPSPGKWDLVTCFEGVEHVPDPVALINNIYNALTPNGVAVISTPNRDAFNQHSGNPFHISEMSEVEFRELINKLLWESEWYAQIDVEGVWMRPKWQRAMIQSMPTDLRQRLQKIKLSKESLQEGTQDDLQREKLKTDDMYPMPWGQAVKSMYAPPPKIIVVVCHKDTV